MDDQLEAHPDTEDEPSPTRTLGQQIDEILGHAFDYLAPYDGRNCEVIRIKDGYTITRHPKFQDSTERQMTVTLSKEGKPVLFVVNGSSVPLAAIPELWPRFSVENLIAHFREKLKAWPTHTSKTA